ncbi:linoleoyl phosphatidylcholine delta-12 acetylenase [Amanita muscaria]
MATPSDFPPNADCAEDLLPRFSPMEWSLKQIKDAIPPHLFVRDTRRGLFYLFRDLSMAALAWKTIMQTESYLTTNQIMKQSPFFTEIAKWTMWLVYWWFQGLIFTGIWVIGHECGHGAFSDHRYVNDVIGFVVHTVLWTPYFSWKISHHRHHSNHASMERDEVYVPKTRADIGIPDEGEGTIDYDEIFGDTPLHTLYMLVRQQLCAFPAYLLYNVSGQTNYPKGTNHLNPSSVLFTKEQRNAVILSNLGIVAMAWIVWDACSVFGAAAVVKYYGIPWLTVTHWFIMITYLHHTDPVLPHYRDKEWNFQRGAAATVDRNFLGWQGRFFLHDVAHYHVIHHFFPKLPFYHGPEATQYLKDFIGEHYMYSDKPVFQALWDNYNNCQFVDNQGDVLFYRDKKGRQTRRPANLVQDKQGTTR